MRLMKLFNKNYLIQNLKKSKAFLALILGLIPLINTLIFLLYSSSETTQMATLQIISIVNYAAVFILPILLAIALFGYSFKRKQIDFISSMPVNRKTIFITNIIGGIAILISIVILNTILILITNMFYPNIVMAPSLLWDYFVYWGVSYIFVFVAASLATTIASNTITTFVVTALILFLIPFLHDSLFGVTGAFLHGMHSTTSPFIPVMDNSYTTPYRLITMAISPSSSNTPFYSLVSIIKMMIISIGYIFIGLYLFTKKKLEVNETSFKNFHVHTIVKCLTMIPLGLVFYDICTNSIELLGALLFLALLLAYYFIYDLITKKSINRVFVSCLYFVYFIIITFFMGFGMNVVYDHFYNKSLDVTNDNIKAISININNSYTYNNKINNIYITDKNVISTFVRVYNNQKPTNNELYSFYGTVIDSKNNKYEIRTMLGEENYKEIIDAYVKSQQFKEEYNTLHDKDILLLTFGNKIINIEEFMPIFNKAIENASDDKIASLFSQNSYDGSIINAYVYDNHNVVSYVINPSADSGIMKYLYKYYKEDLERYLKKASLSQFGIFSIYSASQLNIDLNYMPFLNEKIIGFIKNDIKNEIDFDKPYFTISLQLEWQDGIYYFHSNAIQEFETMYNEASKNIELPTDNDSIGKDIYGQ